MYQSQRPRERIQSDGIELLSTSELLSVVLGSGSRSIPVELLAHKIQKKLTEQKKLRLADLTGIKGIGLAKACQILAVIELVERLRPRGFPLLDNLQKVLGQLGELRYAQREQVMCLYLNARMQLLIKETISLGSVNQSHIEPRDIFAVIKNHPIAYIILAHNHPSGTAIPSEHDRQLTKRIEISGRMLGIYLLDHIILAKEEHYSFKEQNLIKPAPT